jgi:hypothetical protein
MEIIIVIISILIVTLIYSYNTIKKLKKDLQDTRKISWDRYVALTNAINEKNEIKRDMLAMQQRLARYEEKLNQNLNKNQ